IPALAIVILLAGAIRQLDVFEPAALVATLLVATLLAAALLSAVLLATALLAAALLVAAARTALLVASTTLLTAAFATVVLLAAILLAAVLLAAILVTFCSVLCTLVLLPARGGAARQLDAQCRGALVLSCGSLAAATGTGPAAGALLGPVIAGLALRVLLSLFGGSLAPRRSCLLGGGLCGRGGSG